MTQVPNPLRIVPPLLALVFYSATLYGQITNEDVPAIMNTDGGSYLFTDGFEASLSGVRIGDTNGNVSLTVEGGAKLSLTSNPYIGYAAASDGNSVTVSGEGSYFGGASLSYTYIGYEGSNNSLSVLNGATAVLGRLVTSYSNGSTNNAVLVSGSGSTLSSSSPTLLGYQGSTSSLTIADGGIVTSSNRAYIGFKGIADNSSFGGHSVLVTGAGSTWNVSQILSVGNGGDNNRMDIENGGTVSSVGVYIGTGGGRNDALSADFGSVRPSGNTNAATVSGTDSVWQNATEAFYVGKAGSNNSLSITNGGRVENAAKMIISGDGTLSDGTTRVTTTNNTVIVSGANSVLANDGDISIGTLLYGTGGETGTPAAYSIGSLTIADSALVILGSLAAENSILSIAEGSSVQVNGGYLAWFGNFSDPEYAQSVGQLQSLVEAGYFSTLSENGSWVTAEWSDFTVTYVQEGEESGEVTNGLYTDLGGYTILTSTYVIPEPSISMLVAAFTILCIATRRRTA